MSSEKEDFKQSEISLSQKIWHIIKNITVEPLVAFYIIPCSIGMFSVQNLLLDKACLVNLGYSKEVCTALKDRQTLNLTEEETNVQQLIAEMFIWRNLIVSSIPAILIMFLGTWSDRFLKRKPFMLFPLFSEVLNCVFQITTVYFFYEISLQATSVLESLFPSIFGGGPSFYMGAFSYIAENTPEESRTLRIGIVNVLESAGNPLGAALSGSFYQWFGYYGVFTISLIMFAVGLLYGFFFVHDRKIENKRSAEKNSRTILTFLKDFFDLRSIKDIFTMILKKRPGNNKKRLCILGMAFIIIKGPMHGEDSLKYLSFRYRFNWDEVAYSVYSTYSILVHLAGSTMSVWLFSHVLKMDDALIGIIACISNIVSNFIYAFASQDWHLYMAVLVDMVDGTAGIVMRSIGTKLVPPEELGKLNSFFMLIGAVYPLFYGPMYSLIYARTIKFMPGAFFMVGGIITIPAVVIFGWLYKQHRQDRDALETRIEMTHVD